MSIFSRVCPQCGKALGQDERNCSQCGSRTVLKVLLDKDELMYRLKHLLPTDKAELAHKLTSLLPFEKVSFVNRLSSALPVDGFLSLDGMLHTVRDSKRSRVFFIAGMTIILMLILLSGLLVRSQHGSSVVHEAISLRETRAIPIASPIPLFSDNFADNGKGWGIGSGKGFSSSVAHNVLNMSEANHRVLDIPLPGKHNAPALYGDFSATITFMLLKGDANDSVGLFVRGASTNGNFKQGYFVDIYGDNSYDIYKVFADASRDTFLVDPTPSTFINPVGQQNKLTVDMKGAKMVVLINDNVVYSAKVGTYGSGQIALFVENGKTSSGVQAIFSNVIVNPTPRQLPGS